jgi:hypothetical protein
MQHAWHRQEILVAEAVRYHLGHPDRFSGDNIKMDFMEMGECGTVEIFGDDSNKQELHSGENEDKFEFWSRLLPFSPKTSVFSCAI